MVVAIAGGLGTLIVAGLRAPSLGPVHASHWAVAGTMGVLLLASWLWPLVVFRGGESEAAHVDECFFAILALLVPPVLTLGTMALATTVAQAVRRRPLVKSAFNSGQVLTAAGLGLAVSRGLAMPSGSIGLAQAAAIAAGVTVFQIVNTALVAGVDGGDGHDLGRIHQRPADPDHAGGRGRLPAWCWRSPSGPTCGRSPWPFRADCRPVADRRPVRGAV